GFSVRFNGPIFNEFVITSPLDPERLFRWLSEQGVVGGYPLSRHYPELERESLFCVTELNGREDIEYLAELLSRAERGCIS
ncbi:MAG: glycine dehydrogenase, partial [Nitrospinota bacterium]